MKNVILLFCLLLSINLSGQNDSISVDTFQTFSYQEGDTTYVMKQYFMCMLKTGPNRDQDKTLADEIQAGHMAHLNAMAEANKVCMVGPMGDEGEIRGIVIFNTKTLEEAEQLANADPAVKAGRLSVEIHPWWCAVGSKLF